MGTGKPKGKARAIVLTRDDLVNRWGALFAAHPNLDGLEARGSCDDVFCCPDDDGTLDWLALSEASELLFLSGSSGVVERLSKGMIYEFLNAE